MIRHHTCLLNVSWFDLPVDELCVNITAAVAQRKSELMKLETLERLAAFQADLELEMDAMRERLETPSVTPYASKNPSQRSLNMDDGSSLTL